MQKQDAADCPEVSTQSAIGSSWICLILRNLLPPRGKGLPGQYSLDDIAPNGIVVERRFYSMRPQILAPSSFP